MAVRSRRRVVAPRQFTAGPFREVVTTTDPLDDSPDTLQDATNLYIPDPEGRSGCYARPGCRITNAGNAVYTQVDPFRGQGVFSHVSLDGVTTNFCVFAGRLFRANNALSEYTDVTPGGVTIDSSVTTRVYGTSAADQMVVSDGVNRPWLASDLSSTPISGTPIDFDGAGTAWSAFGPPRVYAGSMFFVLNTVGGVAARTDLAWSLPGDVASGYQQTDYDFRWTLEQTATDPLFAIAATNTQLYYWRESSIGSISGTPGPDLAGQATHDAVSRNIGTISPQSVVQFGNTLFFTDALGRPYSYSQGDGEPTAIWLKMRAIVDASSAAFPGINQSVCTATFEPTLNLYLVAPWSPRPSQTAPATEAYIFDARTQRYFGRFTLADGCQIDTLGTFVDQNGRGVLIILGSVVPPSPASLAPSGFVWAMNSLLGSGDDLTTEGGVSLTTETLSPLLRLSTEGSIVNWSDNTVVPTRSITTNRLAYDMNAVVNVDRTSALVGSTAPCAVTAMTAALSTTVEGTPSPLSAADSISRLLCGFDGVQGRGVSVGISPTTADDQWSVQQVAITGVLSLANPDEG